APESGRVESHAHPPRITGTRRPHTPQSRSERSPGLDAHPLVRKHFGSKLRSQRTEAWREGHHRLYKHLRRSAPHHPKTIGQMMPLFHAMAHGCAAALYTEALREVYERRILQNSEQENLYFSTDKLGAYGASLAALAGCFVEAWEKPVDALSRTDQAFVLHETAVHLLG